MLPLTRKLLNYSSSVPSQHLHVFLYCHSCDMLGELTKRDLHWCSTCTTNRAFISGSVFFNCNNALFELKQCQRDGPEMWLIGACHVVQIYPFICRAVFAEGPRDTTAASGNIRRPMFVINRLTGSTLLVLVSANFSILAWEWMPLRADFAVWYIVTLF